MPTDKEIWTPIIDHFKKQKKKMEKENPKNYDKFFGWWHLTQRIGQMEDFIKYGQWAKYPKIGTIHSGFASLELVDLSKPMLS